MNLTGSIGVLALCSIILTWPVTGLSQSVDLSGLLQMKWLAYENFDNYDADDDEEVDSSGFSMRRARLTFQLLYPEAKLKGKLHIRFEKPVQVYDLIMSWEPYPEFGIHLGQMKYPTCYEVLVSAPDLDFVERSQIARKIVDYALARTPYKSDLDDFLAYNRDMGVALKGAFGFGQDREVLRYFVMAGNGLGANMYLGGTNVKGDVRTQHDGEYLWAARLDFSPIEGVTIGGHYNRNLHHDLLYKDIEYDLDRSSWSGDLRISFPGDLRFTAVYCEGIVDDDNDLSGKTDYNYNGYEVSLLWTLLEEKLTLAARWDTYKWEIEESDDISEYRDLTLGVTVMPVKPLKIQLNYLHKTLVSDDLDEFEDDYIVMLFQLRFGWYRIFERQLGVSSSIYN